MKHIMLPAYDTIIANCRGLMIQNFDEKGNSWINYTNFTFWENKMKDKMKLIKKAKTSAEKDREIFNLINFCCMYLENSGETNV